MPNRLSRDQLLHRALDAADLPSLDARDRPDGVLVEGALSIHWLQDALDYFHTAWPWAATVTTHALAVTAGLDTYALATDHIVDVRDGLLLTAQGRTTPVVRGSIPDLLAWKVSQAGTVAPARPTRYVITPPSVILWPTPDQAYTGVLYYYRLPAVITDAVAIPTFPSDYVLVEYVRLRAQEWVHHPDVPVGTAQRFAEAIIGRLQASGQGREGERQAVPLDRTVFARGGPGPGLTGPGWMGPV